MPHRQVNGFPSLVIQLPQVRQAQSADIKLADRCLPDRKTGNPEVISTIYVAAQEAGRDQVRQKAMDGAHRKTRKSGHLLCGEAAGILAEKMEKTQSALQGCNVVCALWSSGHLCLAK